MTLEEMIPLAQKGIKMTHLYFTPDEWLIMKGNVIIFEDGVEIFKNEWIKGKEYLLTDWEEYKES